MPSQLLPNTPAAAIHVWHIPLDACSPRAAGWERLLTAEEHARAARFRFPADRARWVQTRGSVRVLLGHYLDCAPAEVPLIVGAHGKPGLAPGFRDYPLHFNWSHTSHLALLAVTQSGPVGVDVEHLRPDIDPLSLAQSVCSANEMACLRDALPAQRRALFAGFWTGKEAVVKAHGAGLTLPPAGVCVADLARQGFAQGHGFSVRALAVGECHAAALAFEGKDPQICRHIWHG